MADGGTVKIKIDGDSSGFVDAMGEAADAAKKTGTSIGDIFKGVMASQLVTKGISMDVVHSSPAPNMFVTTGTPKTRKLER